jgi:hypothetical protein
MSLLLPLLAIGGLLALSASTKSTPKSKHVPFPDGDFDYMEEDEGDLILEEDGEEVVYEGSGYGDMPVAQMKAVQHYLALLNMYWEEIHGRFTLATEAAIAEFQEFVNLPANGEPTQETLVALADVAQNIIEQYDTFAEEEEGPAYDRFPYTPGDPQPGTTLVGGKTGRLYRYEIVQEKVGPNVLWAWRLQALAAFYPGVELMACSAHDFAAQLDVTRNWIYEDPFANGPWALSYMGAKCATMSQDTFDSFSSALNTYPPLYNATTAPAHSEDEAYLDMWDEMRLYEQGERPGI